MICELQFRWSLNLNNGTVKNLQEIHLSFIDSSDSISQIELVEGQNANAKRKYKNTSC